jgi:hypothetical protein
MTSQILQDHSQVEEGANSSILKSQARLPPGLRLWTFIAAVLRNVIEDKTRLNYITSITKQQKGPRKCLIADAIRRLSKHFRMRTADCFRRLNQAPIHARSVEKDRSGSLGFSTSGSNPHSVHAALYNVATNTLSGIPATTPKW